MSIRQTANTLKLQKFTVRDLIRNFRERLTRLNGRTDRIDYKMSEKVLKVNIWKQLKTRRKVHLVAHLPRSK